MLSTNTIQRNTFHLPNVYDYDVVIDTVECGLMSRADWVADQHNINYIHGQLAC